MTTGRINQITIVYREGCGRRHCKSTGEISSYWVASTRDAPATAPSAYAIGTMFGNPLSHSQFPRTSVRRTEPAGGSVVWASQEEDTAPAFSHCGVRQA